jgi:hypothetical protein
MNNNNNNNNNNQAGGRRRRRRRKKGGAAFVAGPSQANLNTQNQIESRIIVDFCGIICANLC